MFALTGQAISDPLSDAKSAYVSGDYEKAAKLFRPLAEQGNASAQNDLGYMYYSGKGVPKDYKEAEKWYRLSSAQGNAAAQSNLGVMYYNGNGVLKDYKEAEKWFRLLAEQGDVLGQKYIGDMYYDGEGVPQNLVLSYMWYKIAADNAHGALQQIDTDLRDSTADKMTAPQIAEAQELARKCTANKFKGC
jgi:uncharacterized protein